MSRKNSKCMFTNNRPVSFLYTEGKYKPGQHVVQWRAYGICEKIDLEEVLAQVPEYSITEMVATVRARKEINFGQTVVQWCADGICETTHLEEVLVQVPEYSVTEMVATSSRTRKGSNSLSEVCRFYHELCTRRRALINI